MSGGLIARRKLWPSVMGGCALAIVLVGASHVIEQFAAPATRAKGKAPNAEIKSLFRRPGSIPAPRGNIPTPERVALGRRLFHEPLLSANDRISCASCHVPALSFADGVSLGTGIAKETLARHTPSLWNVAWADALFWDGRARTLEEQASGPMEHPKEMGQPLAVAAAKLARDATYARDFAAAFPEGPRITEQNVVRALASFERTLVSPPTRFDRWIEGDDAALSEIEIDGFRLFTGKAGCAVCHSGWQFTDYAFHDIGLPGDDLGRGSIAGLPRVDRAFKTPGLRELVWTAPYMHDGSLATLEDVVRHYESGGIPRPTRSTDMPKSLVLTDRERDSLIAFLESLSSDRPPKPASNITLSGPTASDPILPGAPTARVSQKDKAFRPARISLAAGRRLTVINDDRRPHNVSVYDPRLRINLGVQEPGESAVLEFPEAGTYEAFCGIHPSMRLVIYVR